MDTSAGRGMLSPHPLPPHVVHARGFSPTDGTCAVVRSRGDVRGRLGPFAGVPGSERRPHRRGAARRVRVRTGAAGFAGRPAARRRGRAVGRGGGPGRRPRGGNPAGRRPRRGRDRPRDGGPVAIPGRFPGAVRGATAVDHPGVGPGRSVGPGTMSAVRRRRGDGGVRDGGVEPGRRAAVGAGGARGRRGGRAGAAVGGGPGAVLGGRAAGGRAGTRAGRDGGRFTPPPVARPRDAATRGVDLRRDGPRFDLGTDR